MRSEEKKTPINTLIFKNNELRKRKEILYIIIIFFFLIEIWLIL